jgi:CHAT domain-containing protein/tetratricopeptide (TPR) repeat protein
VRGRRALPFCFCFLAASSLWAGSAEEADALHRRAAALVEQRDCAAAVLLLEQAAAIDESLGADRQVDLARSLRLLGSCLSALGRGGEAVVQLRRAEAIFASVNAAEERALILGEIGLAEYWRARYPEAEADFKQSIALAREHRLTSLLAVQVNNLGLVYEAWGRYDEAISQYRLSREEHTRGGDEFSAAACLGNIANVHFMRSQFPEAEASYKEALENFTRLGQKAYAVRTAVNLGGVYRYWGRYDKARSQLEDALATARREHFALTEASALMQLGAVELATGAFDKAAADYKSALATLRAADVPRQVVSGTVELGAVYYSWGKYDQALELFEESLALAEKLQLPDQMQSVLGLIAAVHQAERRFDLSVSYYQRALGLAEQLGADASRGILLNSLGTALLQSGQTEESEKAYRAALAISERLDKRDETARILIHLGGVQQVKGDYAGARELYQRGLDLSRALGTRGDEATALTNLGLVALLAGDHEEAEQRLLAAIDLKEQLRQTAAGRDRRDFLASWISTYRTLVFLYALDNNAAAAFDAAERIKARYLAEQIKAQQGSAAVRPQGIESVRSTLGPRTAILSFSNMDAGQPIAVLATREAVRLHALSGIDIAHFTLRTRAVDSPTSATRRGQANWPATGSETGEHLSDMLAVYRALLSNARPSPAEEGRSESLGRRLYDRLIAPFEQQLSGKDELIVIPDGLLYSLPFEALRLPDGRFLVERFYVTYLPSLAVKELLDQRRYSARERSLLAVGGAQHRRSVATQAVTAPARRRDAFRSDAQRRTVDDVDARQAYAALGLGSWQDLPGTRAEVESIARIVPGSMLLTGAHASEREVKSLSRSGTLRTFRVLHFATHGLASADAPDLSALVLSEAGRAEGGEDGYLSINEVAQLDVAADFVNLSACNSGIGKIYGGDGVVGLAQAFLEAGANGASVSLSRVSDAATKELMTGLYRLVQQRGLGYAHALTEMKRRFIRRPERRRPSFWAPFVYYGK